jgi:hypothetical protein
MPLRPHHQPTTQDVMGGDSPATILDVEQSGMHGMHIPSWVEGPVAERKVSEARHVQEVIQYIRIIVCIISGKEASRDALTKGF